MAKIETLNTEVCEIHEKVGLEQEGSPTPEQFERVKALNKEIEEIEKQVADSSEFEAQKAAADARKAAMNAPVTGHAHGGAGATKTDPRILTLGQEILDSPLLKNWLKSVCPDGAAPAQGVKLDSPPIEVKSLLKTLITGLSSTSAGAFVTTDRKPIVDQGTFYRELTIMDLISRGNTGSDTVDYVRQGTHVNRAAPVAEATGTGDGTGASPESAMLFEVVTETVRAISHWVPVTRRALADAGQLKMQIDSFLLYGLDEELEDQMITGAGTGENFSGVTVVSGTTAQAFSTDILETLRKARTGVRFTGKARPTAYVMHPNDWEDADLMTDDEARYYFGGPSVLGTPRMWGLPVVESVAATEGQAICAAWNLAALWDREQGNISMSDSHSDFFIKRMVAVLAEVRAAFGVIRPAAFVLADLTA